MRRYMTLLAPAFAPLVFAPLVFAPPVSAQTVIELLDAQGSVIERKVLSDETVMTDRPSTLVSAPLLSTKGGGGVTPETTWFIPRFSIDDSVANGDSTFVSIRHLSGNLLDINVAVEYFDETGVLLDLENIVLTPRQTQILTLRDNPLLVNPGGISTGTIAVMADNELAVDYFQVDFGDNFASGSLAPKLVDFCNFWTYRFLTFGGDSGSEIAFTLNAPQGPDPADPSITGDIYNEAGVFINSFVIRTGLFLVDVPASDLVIGGSSFGSMDILINTLGLELFPGYVTVNHNAFGRFSVGLDAVCTPEEIS